MYEVRDAKYDICAVRSQEITVNYQLYFLIKEILAYYK